MSRKRSHYRPYKVSKPKSVRVYTVHLPALKRVVKVHDKEAALSPEDIQDLADLFLKPKAGK